MTEEEVQAIQNELETIKTELEGIKAEKEALASDKETLALQGEGLASELETKAAAITELESALGGLEQTIGERDSEIFTFKQGTVESVEKVTSLQESLNLAVSAYKTAVAQANPAAPGELITGYTIEAVDQSLESAKSLVSTVRASIEAEIVSGKVPAGAPPRIPPDLESLSPREKIQYAITEGGRT